VTMGLEVQGAWISESIGVLHPSSNQEPLP
jgi:hypothetical protein